MKYHHPLELTRLLSRIVQLAEAAHGHCILRFHLLDGNVVEGRYEGTFLGLNGLGYHSLAAQVLTRRSDDPQPVDLEQVIRIEPVR